MLADLTSILTSAPVAIAVILTVLGLGGCGLFFWMIHLSTRMPGSTPTDLPSGPLGEFERDAARFLRNHVRYLAQELGPRSVERYDALSNAALYLQKQFESFGYEVTLQEYAPGGYARPVANIEARRRGTLRTEERVIIGAHYDSLGDFCPGADDNASGVAALLWLAQKMRDVTPSRTICFVAFVNEEPPFYKTADMGSYRYAQAAKSRGEKIVAMLNLESIGSFSTIKTSQKYPFPLSWWYPDTGNFLAFVGNWRSASILRHSIQTFRTVSRVPSQGFAAPGWFPGVSLSDHWSFWKCGYPAFMITGTAPYRNQYYHTENDRWDTLDYESFARSMTGIEAVVRDLIRVQQ